MSAGSDALRDVYAKLDRAVELHEEMECVFHEYAKPGGGDDRPIGIRFRERDKPAGLTVLFFNIDEPMPRKMSLLAADVVHNTRVALDHVLARLKDHFGGDPGRGSFPTWRTEADWQRHVVDKGKGSALHRLDPAAVALIEAEQPLHSTPPEADPLVILNKLDNADKHRLLCPAFVYTGVQEGIDLIEVLDATKVRFKRNLWTAGEPLEDGTEVALFMVTGPARNVLRVRRDAEIGFASGEVDALRIGYTDMIDRVREIADKAAALIDR